MAKKREFNKTQAVQDYLKSHRKAKAAEIAEALDKQGITITPGHVANIKSKLKRLRREGRVRRARAGAGIAESPELATEPAAATAGRAARPGEHVTLDQIKRVAQSVRTIGGYERLKELLDVVREVGGIKKFRDLLDAMSGPDEMIPF